MVVVVFFVADSFAVDCPGSPAYLVAGLVVFVGLFVVAAVVDFAAAGVDYRSIFADFGSGFDFDYDRHLCVSEHLQYRSDP